MTRTIGWTLLHFLWQGAAVASVLACLNLALRRSTPQLRYLAAGGSLLLMLALPAATFRLLSASPAAVPGSAGPFVPATDAAIQATVSLTAPLLPGVGTLGQRVESLLPVLVTSWSAGVLLLCLRSFGGMAFVRRLGRSGLSAAPPALEATLARLARTIGVATPVRLYQSALVGVPTVVGWFRPVILLPASALTGLTAHQLELILAHELAHVYRHDYLVNLVQSAAETLLFYHPAVWWVSNRMRIEREHCCDDLAVAACGSPVHYARALARLEGLCSDAPALAMAANGGSLFDRIARLVGRAPEPSRAARGVAAGLAVASLALALGIGSILLDRPAPTVVDVMASSPAEGTTTAEPVSVSLDPAPATQSAPVAQAAPATKPAPAAEPQARAFPLERVLEMARAGITPGYIDEMDALGYASLSSEQLVALRHQGIGPDYVRELAALGYKNLSTDQLLGLRSQGVSASFVKGLTEQGLKDLSLSNLLALRSQGVTPGYVAELKEAGQTDLSVTSLLSLRSQGVSGSFVSGLKALGYGSLSESQLLALRSQGVGPAYVRELAELGYRNLDTKLLLALRSQGVGPDYVRALQQLGYQDLQVGQLIELRAQGVTPDYVRELKAAGFDKLTPEELVTLRSQGISARLLKSLRGRQ